MGQNPSALLGQIPIAEPVGRTAKLYPDVNFIIYHSGLEIFHREGPFDPARATHGVEALIRSLLDNGIAPNSNVYAELSSTWRFVMRDPTMAAHLLGKLLVHVGQNNVLWGTDSIWYSSPQDQIQAFRAFEIAPTLLAAHRYPELTSKLKAKIFGLNGARVYGVDVPDERKKTEADPVGLRKQAYRERATPVSRPSDPRTTANSTGSWLSARACQPDAMGVGDRSDQRQHRRINPVVRGSTIGRRLVSEPVVSATLRLLIFVLRITFKRRFLHVRRAG